MERAIIDTDPGIDDAAAILFALGSGRRWSVLLKGYTGPAPYGEFYRDHVSSVGVGVGFTL